MSRALALAVCLAFASAAACGGKEPAPLFSPDPTKVNELRTHAKTYADAPFMAKVPTLFRTTDLLPDLDVRALAFAGTRLYAGTGSGLVRLASGGDRFERVDLGMANEPIVDLALSMDGRLIAAGTTRIHVLSADGGRGESWVATSSSAPLRAVIAAGATIFAGTDRGLFKSAAARTTSVSVAGRVAIRDLASVGSVLWIATGAGILRYDTAGDRLLPALNAPTALVDDDVRALAVAADGTILAASAAGISRLTADGATATFVKPGIGGLPNGDLRAIAEGGGEVLSGHGVGATITRKLPGDAGAAMAGGVQFEHLHSLRWIPGEVVTAVALGADRTRWIGTHAGIGRVALSPTTLAAKADLDEQYTNERHWRMDGFIDDDVSFDDPWTLAPPIHHDDKDNDGLWTEMQIGSWCFAYATTKDEKYYQRARKAMDVMLLEFDVPAATFVAAGKSKGFITRSLVREDEGTLFSEKSTMLNWHLQEFGGKKYYWKDDTSSDEYAGHYWGIPIFYDLCAKTEDEKQALRDRIRSSTDYLIANGYLLIDLNGKGTTHGHWINEAVAADTLDGCPDKYSLSDCLSSYGGGGWLNGMEILGHLLAAWHMTGDSKYYDEYERLYTQEKYGKLIPITDHTLTVTDPTIANHSDHELATLAYHTLQRYEPNPDRRAVVARSLIDFYGREREEHNPWQLATVAAAVADDVDLDGAVKVLQELPTDWREWPYDNSHRVDANRGPPDRGRGEQFTRVFPYDELRTSKWNSNPYEVRGGGSGKSVIVPTTYLIAYWMLRYYGLIR